MIEPTPLPRRSSPPPAPHGRRTPGAGLWRRTGRRADERAFLPAVLEVIETPASPTARATALVLCALVTGALLWSWLAHVDMVAVAPGKVVPLGQVKVVQPLETSAIRTIAVDDGDHVRAGQLLVELDPTDVKSELTALIYDRGQAALDAEVARVLTQGDPQAAFAMPAGVDPALAETSHAQAVAEIRKHAAQIAELDAEIEQKRAALDANTATLRQDRATLPLLEEKAATARGLYDRRNGLRPTVLDTEQTLIEKRAELATAEATARQIAGEMAGSRAKRDEIGAGFEADAADRRVKALQKLADLDQQIAKARQREGYRRLVSPVDGVVQTVKIHTPGAVVTTADTLMTVVPDGVGIEVEAAVANQDIGFVREGQAVAIKVEAFPFTRYGLLKGTVRKLGRDATPAASPGAGRTEGTAADAQPATALTYPAKVALEQDWIVVDGKPERLQPGMTVSAEIKTGNRRVLDYLLSPVMQTINEAGRER